MPPDIGRYYANCHKQQGRNPDRFILYIKANTRVESDGLNSIQYQKVKGIMCVNKTWDFETISIDLQTFDKISSANYLKGKIKPLKENCVMKLTR